jgi:hypothetical protein
LDEPIFEYFDSSYDGSATAPALIFPVTPINIRLVRITVKIDSDPLQSPDEFIVTTQVSVRNAKDNL